MEADQIVMREMQRDGSLHILKLPAVAVCQTGKFRMSEVQQLKEAVEGQHSGTATFAQSVPVKETFGGKTVWEGVVHVFTLTGHPKASLAYAWSSPIEGSDKRRFFAVLHVPPITSPVDAVRAAVVAEHKAK